MTRNYWIYMLECENGSYYTGYTDDLSRRFDEHCRGTAKSKFTRSFKPIRIVQCWKIKGSKGNALKIECLIKGLSRDMKNEIISDPEMLLKLIQEKGDIPCAIEVAGINPKSGEEIGKS